MDVTKQFDEVYREHHDPKSREKKRILEYREKRLKDIKKDRGL